jgi:hypothetical protein
MRWSLDQYLNYVTKQKQNSHHPAGKTGDVEPPAGHEPNGPLSIPPIVTGKVAVLIENWRLRLADSDGISCKALIDFLCRIRDPKDPAWRLIPGDKARDINLVVVQRHCKNGEPEQVIITIERNDNESNENPLRKTD